MIKLPPLREIVERNGLLPDKIYAKRYGQNFIFDENITHKIVRFANLKRDALVMEVGPGPGGLTRAILSQEPQALCAIEYEPLCVKALSYLTDVYTQLHIIQADALTVNLSDIISFVNDLDDKAIQHDKLSIIANLPYNISTELLVRWLSQIEFINTMTLMFQKEVALRIMATPHSKEYGRLSIIAQGLCDIEHGFDLPPSVFTPAPKIDSSVISFVVKPDALDKLFALPALQTITNVAFQQRRKVIRTPLKSIFKEYLDEAFEVVGMKGDERAENISVEQYWNLASWWSQRCATNT